MNEMMKDLPTQTEYDVLLSSTHSIQSSGLLGLSKDAFGAGACWETVFVTGM